MPPKAFGRRKAAAKRAPSPEPEPDAPETITTPRGKTIETTAASSRTKRSIAMPSPDQPAAKKAKIAKEENGTPKRGPGRPRKDGAVTPQKASNPALKRGPGRPRKDGAITPQKANAAAPAAKKGPGRTSKSAAPQKSGRPAGRKSDRLSDVSAPKTELPRAKRRGRYTAAAAPVEDEEGDEDVEEEEIAPVVRRGRGRPPKNTAAVEGKEDEEEIEDEDEDREEEEPAPVARRDRGRPPKNTATKKVGRPRKQRHYHLQHLAVDEQIEAELTDAAESTPVAASKSKRNTAKSKKPAAADEEDEDVDISNDANITEATTIRADFDLDDEEDEDRSYWLMKAEPESRIEENANGDKVDVKFTIDDLHACSEPEPWDGIRNAQAQKNMKAMKVGDLAFFYESNCKKPGVVGIMEIVREATPDMSAFSKDSAYYDAKSDPSKPKWMAVHVQFRRKFAEKLTLKTLQKFGQPGGALANMGVFKQSRLSVSKVSKPEWDFVLGLIEDDDKMEEPAAAIGGDLAGEEVIDDTADLGTDFAMAFEAPANLGASEAFEELQAPTADQGLLNTEDLTAEPDHAAQEPFAGPIAPTNEELKSEITDGPTASSEPTNGLHVKSQARSVSRGRSQKPVPAPSFRADTILGENASGVLNEDAAMLEG